MRTKLWLAGGIAGALLCGPGARADVETEEEHWLSDLVVRPERDVLLAPRSESAALDIARTELSAEALRALTPATPSDALKFAPGVHTETRGRKYKHLHSFRGQIYPYPDVVVNGIWEREAQDVFYVYPGAALERIEIMRSAATLFTGLADVVGVIHLVPRAPRLEPDAAPPFEAGVEAGSHGMARAYGLREFRDADRGAVTVGAQRYRSDGPSARNAAEEITSLFGLYTHPLAPGHRLDVGGWLLHGYRELEMPDPDGPASRNLKNRKERYDPMTFGHLHARGFHQWTPESTTEWTAFYSDRRARYRREKIDPAGPGPGPADVDEDDREYGAQAIQGVAWSPENTLRLGLFLHRWTAPDGKKSYVGARQDVSSYAVALANERRAGDWTFDAGLRYARSYLHNYSSPAFDIAGTSTSARPVSSEWDDPVLSGTLGAHLDLSARHRLFAHGGVGERRPGPGAVMPDGSDPDTELRTTADGGWAMAWGANRDGLLRLGGFGVWRRDAITRINETGVDELGNEFYFSGNQDIRQRGLEMDVETPRFWQDRLALSGSLTWMQSEVKAEGGYDEYREIPTLNLSAGLHAAAGAWDGALLARHVDGYENFRFAQDGEYHDLGDYWDLVLSGGVRLGAEQNVRLYAAVDNLLDEEYSTVVGWNDSGRRFRAGLEASF